MKEKTMEPEKNRVKTYYVEITISDIKTNSFSLEKSFVVPGYIHVESNDKISWKPGNTGASFIFPKGDILFESGKKNFQVKQGGHLTLTISPDAPAGSYPYVVITDNDELAIGGSYPRIIVE